jgi:hypothetical protein
MPTYGDIPITKTIENNVTVVLHGHGINGKYFVESVESNVAVMQR